MATEVVDEAFMEDGWAEVSVDEGKVWLTVKEGADGKVGGRVAILSMTPYNAAKLCQRLFEASSKAMENP